ncbi:MAG: hypothetical protein R3C49_06085 [Planctomycetaceae bacterium]
MARSDYQTLEEAEAASDSEFADSGSASIAAAEKERKDTLVSETKDVDPEAKPSKGLFAFRNPFKRSDTDEEFSDDPFVDAVHETPAAKTSEKTVAKATETARETKADIKTAAKSSNPAATLADMERRASEFDTEGFAQQVAAATHTAKDSDAQSSTTKPGTPDAESFADFLKRQATESQDALADAIADSKAGQAAQKTAGAVTDKVATAKESAEKVSDGFDAFLNEKFAAAESTEVAVQEAAQAKVQGVSEDFFAVLEQPGAPNSAAVAKKEPTSPEKTVSPFGDVPFQTAAQQHGFTSSHSNPWDAFKTASLPGSPEHGVNSGARSGENRSSDGFTWAHQKEQATGFDVSSRDSVGIAEQPTFQDPFTTVSQSSSATSAHSSDPTQSLPTGGLLVIPETPAVAERSEPVRVDNSLSALLNSAPDPWEDKAVSGTELAMDEATGDDVSASVTVAGTSGRLGISRRTWFLLIGLIIVAFLLFMPDRHNRANTNS